jgi:hypothetical protein
MPPRHLAPLAALALSACLGARPVPPPAARGPFPTARADAVLVAAIDALRERGYEIDACDSGTYALTSGRIERDAPCYLGSCLARQTVTMKLGYKTARVRVAREVWDWSVKEWVAIRDPALEREETELLKLVLAAQEGVHADRWGDPCPSTLVASFGATGG